MAEGTHNRAIHELQAAAGGARAGRVLLVDEDQLVRESVARTLARAGHDVVATAQGQAALARLAAEPCDVLLVELRSQRPGGPCLLTEVKRLRPDVAVVLITAYAGMRSALQAVRQGAYDYIQKPFEKEELLLLVERALEHVRLRRRNLALHAACGADEPARPLIGNSSPARQARVAIERAGRDTAPVLISGECGTGKTLAARLVHDASIAADAPLLAVRCAGRTEQELAADLFGSDPPIAGVAPRPGAICLARGTTLLLENMSGLGHDLASQLIRAILEKTYQPVGASVWHRAEVRWIFTRSVPRTPTSADVIDELLERQGAIRVELPPLRDRREDIPDLVRHFLHRVARRDAQPFRHIETEALRLLQKYPWPGNVRELEHLIERAAAVESQPGIIRAATLAPWFCDTPAGPTVALNGHRQTLPGDPLDRLPLAEVEKRVILDTLAKFEGHRAKTATALGIGIRTLGIKLKKWRQDGELAELPYA